MRDKADYNCAFVATEDEVVELLAPTRNMVKLIGDHLSMATS